MNKHSLRVYRIEFDAEHFQSLEPVEAHVRESGMLHFDGSSKAEIWVPFLVRVANPHLQRGDFFHLAPGCIVIAQPAIQRLHEVLNYGYITHAELLRLPFERQVLHVVNPTECLNALDREKTVWRMESGRRAGIEKYVFHASRLGWAMPFSIPETAEQEVLTLEITGEPSDEFKAAVESLGLTGIRFVELWRSE